MDKVEILVIGRDKEILEVVLRLINNNISWHGVGACADEEAIEKFHQHRFDIVLLTNGIAEDEEKKLRTVFIHQDTDIIIIQHYGGGSGLLSNEIRMALDNRKNENRPSYTFKDFGTGD